MEKATWKKIILQSLFPVLVVAILTPLFSWIIAPTGRLSVGTSFFDGVSYVTPVHITNFQRQTALRDVDLFFSQSTQVIDVRSNSPLTFSYMSNYFTAHLITPNATNVYLISSNQAMQRK